MSETMKDTIRAISDGGGLAVLVAVLGGLFYLAIKVFPAMKDFFVGLTASQAAHTEKLAVTDAKVEALLSAHSRLTAAVEKLGETAAGAIVRAGDAAGSALGKLGDVVAAEGFETRSALADAERRLTGAIRREQVSDPPPRSTLTPSTGIPPVKRRSDA